MVRNYGVMPHRWVLKAGAKTARNRQTQHSPRGLLSLMEPCEDNKCRAWGNVTKKNSASSPPVLMWHMRIWGRSGAGAMKMLICTPPKGGLGLGMGPLWDPSIRTPVRRTPARRRPAPPGRPLSPDKKNSDRPVQQHSQPGHWGR